MNLNLFDDVDGLILRERENMFLSENVKSCSDDSDEYNEKSEFPPHTPLAMAYVPFQQWGDVKSPEKALECGTLFSDLVFPFEKGGNDR